MNKHIIISAAVGVLAASAHAQLGARVVGTNAPPEPAPVPQVTADNIPVPRTPYLPDLTPGYVVIEGDIQVRLDQYLAMINSPTGSTFGNVPNYWTTQIVPYDFVTTGVGAVSAANQQLAIGAMNAIASRVNLQFRPATGIEDRIRFQNSNFNNSPVGRQGGPQIINIVSWGTQIIICHEIYHSLGFWHEQSRTDRDTFVTINGANICGSGSSGACNATSCCLCADSNNNCISCAFNFNIVTGTSNLGVYDFDSFMHYPRTAFSCNGSDTITVNPTWNAQWQNAIGQRDHFSYYDAVTCRGLYPYGGDRWLDRTYFGTQGGTLLQPWNVSFASAVSATPSGGALFFRGGGNYSAIGTYSNPVTIDAPGGAATLGN